MVQGTGWFKVQGGSRCRGFKVQDGSRCRLVHGRVISIRRSKLDLPYLNMVSFCEMETHPIRTGHDWSCNHVVDDYENKHKYHRIRRLKL